MASTQGSGSARYVVIAVALLATVQCAMGTTYNVGDNAGWNLNVNYSDWTAQKTFKVGDSLVFKYGTGLHTVLQVNEADYKACNLAGPLKSYSSGDDTVTLTDATTHYFICGVPNHCTAGMAVAISVSGGSTPSAPSPAPTVSPAPKVSPMPSPPKGVPSPAPAYAPASKSPSPSPISPSPSETSPSPASPSETSPSTSPSESSSSSPPSSSSVSPSAPPSSNAQAPSTQNSAASSSLHSGTVVLLSAILLGGLSLFF